MQSLNKIHINLDNELKNIINKDNQYTIPIFIPHLGCKNECVFCNQRKISGNTKIQTIDEIREDIDRYLGYIKKDRKVQIAFFGGSFTGIDINDQVKYLTLANEYIKSDKVDSIRISTRPDYIDVNILKVLKKYNVETIELGVQSMDKDVLEASKRGHTSIQVIRASLLINLFKIKLGFQIMIGLPKSNVKKEVETIEKLLKFNPKQLRIYPVYVLEESKLYDMYLSHEYIPLKVQDAVLRTAEVVKVCNKSNVQIIRIGLQSTNEITASNSKLLGPVSDNFAEYVLAKLVLEKIEISLINTLKVEDVDKSVDIFVKSKYISIASGPNKINKKYLEEKYNIKLKIR
ncbi:MAG: radical SAM protein [Clostridia bacterium]